MAFIRESSTSSISDSLSGTLSVTGLITATAGIKLGNNIVYNSAAEATLTLDADQNVAVAGDLTVTGNDIKSSSATVFTLSGANAAIAGDLTINGGDAIVKAADSAAATITLQSDNSDDAGDDWKITAHTDQTLLIGNDIASEGTFVSHITCTPHATTALSTVAVAGKLQVGGHAILNSSAESCITLDADQNVTVIGDLTVTGGDATITGANDAVASILMQADNSDDAGDDWKLIANTNQTFTLCNDIASAGSYVALLTVTPHATAASSLVQIAGDLEVNGGRLTFGNDEYIHNESDGILRLTATSIHCEGTLKVEATSGTTEFRINTASSSTDSKMVFQKQTANIWYMGNDGDDNTLHIGTGNTVATNSMLKFSATGQMTSTLGMQSLAVARTATDDGSGDGTIAAGTSFVSVNADSDANHILILPAPVVGNIIYIAETASTGYELRSSNPASIGINGGTGSNVESAIAGAITYIKCVCVSSTSWICSQYDADGDESKVAAAS
jgi:ethanolamine utilization microcompartment shell protein EutS